MNTRIQAIIGIVVLGLSISFLQLLAAEHHLYWEFWWYDIIMHFLGGTFVGVVFLWFLFFVISKYKTHLPLFVTTFVFVLGVGIAWEIFEYLTDSYNAVNYTLDTSLDLLMDIAGMMVAYLAFKRL